MMFKFESECCQCDTKASISLQEFPCFYEFFWDLFLKYIIPVIHLSSLNQIDITLLSTAKL